MSKTILLVDDYPDFTSLLAKHLRMEGYQTLVANNGQDAIKQAKSKRPDLIVLDIMMPDLGGTEVRVELLKDSATKDIPIIFLTGLRSPNSKRKSSMPGVKTIGKASDFKEILGTIRETLK